VKSVVAATAAVAFALTLPAAGRAETSAEVRALAARASHDPAALARLRAVTSVDGRPLALAALLSVSGDQLTARLHTLAEAGAVGATAAAAAREHARRILAERRFTGSTVPRPLHGVLAWLGGKLSFIPRWAGRLARHVPGGSSVAWALLSLAVLGVAALQAARVGRRRQSSLVATARDARAAGSEDPGALERSADRAEADGDLERALRLRFRAGLIRLGRAGRIPPRASLTSGEAAKLLALDDFDDLARRFDEVVYGARPPDPTDLERSRRGWQRVLAGARQR